MSGRGLLITFEGVECSGKTTQVSLLAEAIRRSGDKVIILREPGSTELGEKIRSLFQNKMNFEALTARSELLLFAASRAQLCSEKIIPALQRGEFVICDRFIDSSVVYQGHGRGIPTDEVVWINRFATQNLEPDITFILDLEVKEMIQRLRSRNMPLDRFEVLGYDFHQKVREAYLNLAEAHPHRCIVLKATISKEELAAEIFQHLIRKKNVISPRGCD
ncbi:MAG: dTMP kinase [Chthoniobacterales bacterium]|nr:dTMP kinase [Chthoniobacterales bacterium]MCX7712247.1 dTMP kinase [Chthoniobacterales bacterium]